MALKLSDDVKALVSGANFAHLATLMTDGSPQVAPVWVDLEGDFVLVRTGEGSLKAKNTRRDARVGISVIAMDNPYREAQLRGRVVERRPDPDFKTMDRISRKYTSKPFPFRDNPAQRVVLVIAVERLASRRCRSFTRPREPSPPLAGRLQRGSSPLDPERHTHRAEPRHRGGRVLRAPRRRCRARWRRPSPSRQCVASGRIRNVSARSRARGTRLPPPERRASPPRPRWRRAAAGRTPAGRALRAPRRCGARGAPRPAPSRAGRRADAAWASHDSRSAWLATSRIDVGPLDRLLQQRHRRVDSPAEQVRGAERRRDEGRQEGNALEPREHEPLLECRDRLVEASLDHGRTPRPKRAWKRLYA